MEAAAALQVSPRQVVDKKVKSARRLRPNEIEEVVAGYRAGSSVYELANRHHITCGTVAKHLEARGVMMHTEVQDHESDLVVELFTHGQSANVIGRVVGRDPKTVRSISRAHGLTPLTRHAAPS